MVGMLPEAPKSPVDETSQDTRLPKRNWEGVSAVSAAIAAGLSAIGVLISVSAANDARSLATRALQDAADFEARAGFSEYLRLAIQHPDLASGSAFHDKDPANQERYTWFVSNMLVTCERLMASSPNDAGWLATCQQQVCYHSEYLKSGKMIDVGYTEEVQALMRTAIEGKCEN